MTTRKRKYPSGHQKRLKRKAAGRWTEDDERRERERLRKKDARAYQRRAEMIDSTKIRLGCADCGYRAHPAALHFDHLPGCNKVAAISQLRYGNCPLEKLEREVAKCEVVCANCHAIRTVTRRGGSRL